MSNNTTANTLPIIGILGDGQLSMMMAEAYHELGGKVAVFGANDSGPASVVADQLFTGDPENMDDIAPFFNAVDIVTLENEFLDSNVLIQAADTFNTPIRPNPKRFQLIEDKLSENHFFQNVGVEIADFFEVKDLDDLLDVPGYLKLAKGGYDGIGTYRVNNKQEAIEVYNTIKSAGVVIFEHAIDFSKELSMIAVSNSTELAFYPLVETHQEDNICRYVSFPANVETQIEEKAKIAVEKIMAALDTHGLFAFELFLTKDNQILVNESAPRPHNSGHITLDSMNCSQFENHMRAVADLPLKQPTPRHDSMLMANLLGTHEGDFDPQTVTSAIDDQNLTVKLYRKQKSRIKRKMGHINLWGENQWQRAKELMKRLEV